MTITVTPTVEASNIPPRIRLNIAASAGETSTTVTRLDPDGNTRSVRTSDGNPLVISGGTALVYDYEMQYQASVTYSSLESPATVSSAVSVPETDVWLVHPGVPALSLPITVQAIGPRVRKVLRGVFYPMGRTFPVVQSDGARKAAEYTLTLYTPDDNGRLAIETLVEDAGVLLLNVPATKAWGIDAEYVAVGDTTEARPLRLASYADRSWDLPLTVVDVPIGGSQSARTYADILAGYASYAAVKAHYSTYLTLLSGP